MPRLHGFHRFLPHLWELFYWPQSSLEAVVRAGRDGLRGRGRPRLRRSHLGIFSVGGGFLENHAAGGIDGAGTPALLALDRAPDNRNDPDFLFSLPILLNWH